MYPPLRDKRGPRRMLSLEGGHDAIRSESD
jgi:hypothetical protein